MLISGKQIVELRLNDYSDEDDESVHESPTESFPSRSSFVFGLAQTDLRLLHPSPAQISLLGDFYLANFDSLFKLLHKPSMQSLVRATIQDRNNVPGGKGAEALMFAIYFAAITSLNADECIQLFGEEQSGLLARYRYASERALAQADFLNSMELVTLQAFSIFLVCALFSLRSKRTSVSACINTTLCII